MDDERARNRSGEVPLTEVETETGPVEDLVLEQASPSLRHMAANGLTPDGMLERLSIEADMANTPGWPYRRVMKGAAWFALIAFGLAVLANAVTALHHVLK